MPSGSLSEKYFSIFHGNDQRKYQFLYSYSSIEGGNSCSSTRVARWKYGVIYLIFLALAIIYL